VVATADRLATAMPAPAIAEVGGASEPVECALVPAVAVAGKVVERGGRAPVAGVDLSLWEHSGPHARQAMAAVTGADGSFTIEHVLPGDYDLRVEPMSSAIGTLVTVAADDVTGVTVEVERMASISGRVTAASQPVDGAVVITDGARGRTDRDGRFELRGLAAGTHRLYAESRRVGAFTLGAEVAVASGEHKTGVDVVLDLAGSISGVVVDQHAAPVSGVVVRFQLVDGADGGRATTADDGTFTAGALSGGGSYACDVRPADGSPLVYRPAGVGRFPPIAVRDGKTHVTGVRLQIRHERLEIAGRVVSDDDRPVPDVMIRAVPDGSRVFGEAPTTTSDSSGAFAIRDLTGGSYALSASSTRGDVRIEHVAAGRRDVAIRLPRTGAIEGTCDGFALAPDVYAMLDVPVTDYEQAFTGHLYRAAVTGNRFRVSAVPPGTYHVVAQSPSGQASATASVTSGATARLALHNPGVGSIAGIVIDPVTHQPVAGATCHAGVVDGHVTDASGAFRFDGTWVGTNFVMCQREATFASARVDVRAGQIARVELVLHGVEEPRRGHAGMELQTQLEDAVVTAIEPGGPADRAGLAVGDVISEIDDRSAFGMVAADWIESRGPGATVKLAIERGDKSLTVELTLAAP